MNRGAIAERLPAPDGRTRIDKRDAINPDIIGLIHRNFPIALSQVRNSGAFKELQGRTAFESAGNVWSFLKNQIQYRRDPDTRQMIRMPNRFVKDGYGDCKSFSLFAASFLAAMGYPVAFRYASYSSSAIPSHVYVVTKDEQGREIIVDGVWKRFNSEKGYTSKKDFAMQTMTLSGIFGRAERRKKRQEKRAGRQQRRDEKAEKRGGARGAKRIALAPARAAFLSVVLLNFRGLATKLAAALKKNPDRTKKLWNKLGGNFNKFSDAINKGAQKKRILGIDESIEGIGSVAALAATAAPILVAVVKFLKGEGIQDEDSSALLDTGLEALESSGQKELPNNLSELDVDDAEPGSGSASASSLFSNPKVLLIGGAIVVGGIILLSKKRK